MCHIWQIALPHYVYQHFGQGEKNQVYIDDLCYVSALIFTQLDLMRLWNMASCNYEMSGMLCSVGQYLLDVEFDYVNWVGTSILLWVKLSSEWNELDSYSVCDRSIIIAFTQMTSRVMTLLTTCIIVFISRLKQFWSEHIVNRSELYLDIYIV